MRVKLRHIIGIIGIVLSVTFSYGQIPYGQIPFQGMLTTSGSTSIPDGTYRLTFRLYTTATGGTPIWTETQNVSVHNGIFSVLLGSVTTLNVSFDQVYYLGITIGNGSELAPRIRLGAVPFSIRSRWVDHLTTENLGTILRSNGAITLTTSATAVVIGVQSDQALWNAAQLQGRAIAAIAPSTGQVLQWNGNQWTPVTLSGGGGGSVGGWSTTGNLLGGSEFLGSINNQPVRIRVNNQTVFRWNSNSSIQRDDSGDTRGAYAVDLQQIRTVNSEVASGDYSVIGGGRRNVASALYAVVGGGYYNGSIDTAAAVLGGFDNTAAGKYSAILGGSGNTNRGDYSVIGGGAGNTVDWYAGSSVIGGGEGNLIAVGNSYAVIGGGYDNSVDASHAFIGGGTLNDIGIDAQAAVIGGGDANQIRDACVKSFIGGGSGNDIRDSVSYGVIVGGRENTIYSYAEEGTISGGGYNSIGYRAPYSVVGGGHNNDIADSAEGSVIAGGMYSDIAARARSSTISGGYGHDIRAGAYYATISGGSRNDIGKDADATVISGGRYNTIADSADYASIGGGRNNWIATDAIGGRIGGGRYNRVWGRYAVVAGGGGSSAADSNTAYGNWSAILGGKANRTMASYAGAIAGYGNTAQGAYSVVAGGENNVSSGAHSVINGGRENTAAGAYSVVSGGQGNAATADYSWVGGRAMTLSSAAAHSFVWGYATSTTAITAADAFLIGPYGNTFRVGINVSNPTYALELPNSTVASVGKARANDWITYSDERVKTEIRPITNALAIVERLQPVRYKHHSSSLTGSGVLRIDDRNGESRYGFLAQQLAAVVPEVVEVPQSPLELWGISYAQLIPLLTAAIQQQQQQIQQLQLKLQQLYEWLQFRASMKTDERPPVAQRR